MGPDAELVAAVGGRPQWRLDGDGAAVYQRPGDAWHIRVVAMASGAGHRERYRAILVTGGTARRSRPAGTAVEAVRWAEGVWSA